MMVADISDILAEVDAQSIPQRTLDLQALTRAWINERTSPELLPYPTDLIERHKERIQSQISTIEDLTSNLDPKSNFTLVILQTELERFKFLLRSYLRARLAKIDRTPLHYRNLVLAETPHLSNPILSKMEQQYLAQHQALLSQHYESSFLLSLPTSLQKLDDQAGGISMIDKPDEDSAVFARVLRDAGEVTVYGETETTRAELRRGDVWVLRWKEIKDAVERGDVELI